MSALEQAVGGPAIEVVAKATRRRFSVDYKRKIVREADGCKTPGAVGALLRREGWYSSHLTMWRAARPRWCSQFQRFGPSYTEAVHNLCGWAQRFLADVLSLVFSQPSVSRPLTPARVVVAQMTATGGFQRRRVPPDNCCFVGFSSSLLG
jgi:hypothetical protein